MENKKNEIMNTAEEIKAKNAEIAENSEATEVDELEFVSSELDVKDYPAPAEAETSTPEAEAPVESEEPAKPAGHTIEEVVASVAEWEDELDDDDDDLRPEDVSPKYLVKLVMTLTAICTVIALLLAVVNNVTKDRIAENVAKQQQAAILAIFTDGTDVEEYTTADGETVYVVLNGTEVIGYCINAYGTGFGGEVQVMVGLNADKTIHGLKIVSASETPGIGTKIQSESFLGQFVGKASADADIISGATFSSKAVIEAVDYALGVDFDLNSVTGGKEADEPTDSVKIENKKGYADTVNVPTAGSPVISDSTVIYTLTAPERESESPWPGFVADGNTQE